ncbi:hypothetical protein [Nostoc sp.]|uniref:hypothetical protein n=1 Tax=Nostoc sp. TaxID=1180 RepID=UPI002FFC1C48
MIKIKSLILALSLSPLLLSAWQLPNQAQLSPNTPSKGTAGSVSGNNSGAASGTIFSVPVTLQTGGTTKFGNITVTNSSGTLKISVPPNIQNILNTSAQRAVVTLRTGGLTQQQIAALVGAVAPLIVNTTEAPVPGGILVIVNRTQALVPGGVSLSTGSSQRQSFATIAAAIRYVRTIITTLPVNGSISVKIGGNTTVMYPIQAQSFNNSLIETIKKVVTLKQPNGETFNFEIVGPRNRVNNADIILAFVLAAGVDPSAANTSIRLGLTGADPISTSDLILSLNGLVTNQNAVNLTKLNQAINAYNTIVDKADTNSLKALNNTTEFTNIGGLLRNTRAPLD